MHITHIETLCLSRPHEPEIQWATASYKSVKADCAIVVIHTDEGLTGIGEATPYGVPPLIREWVSWLGPRSTLLSTIEPLNTPVGSSRGSCTREWRNWQTHQT